MSAVKTTKRMRTVMLCMQRWYGIIPQRKAMLQEETTSTSQWPYTAKFNSYLCHELTQGPRLAEASFPYVPLQSSHTTIRASVQSVTSAHNSWVQGSANYHLWASRLFLYLKAYWNMAALTPVHTVCGCFHAPTAELSNCRRDWRTPELKPLTI